MPDSVSDAAPDRAGGGSVTRGFLFADLRGYTDFVERRGAAAAAELLGRYRELVRREVGRFDGAEIRTEGDSFYVVFGSVTAAVRCGIAIVESARAASAERPGDPIRVGVGVHAGETVETPEGYVGQPVNIAARLCSVAAAGEVLVSDTVRALSQSMLPVRFIPRGRRRLKGIADPLAVYAVEPVDAAAGARVGGRSRPAWSRRRRLGALGVMGVALVAVATVAFVSLGRNSGLPPGTWTIGVAIPRSGLFASFADALRLAVELAVNEVNAVGGIDGSQVAVATRDTSGEQQGEDPEVGAQVASQLVADPAVVAMIGPATSGVAASQIPITNEAGLLHCGPATAEPVLTKPRAGALDLRAAHPDRINFVRLAAAADIEAAAGASFAYHDLGARRALVVDDAQFSGRQVADAFEVEFGDLGGEVVRRTLNPGAEPAGVLDPLGGPAGATLVFFGGFAETGAPDVRRAMVDLGFGDRPFLSWDAISRGTGEDPESFITLAGDAAVGSYVSRPSVGTVRADFERRFRAANGFVPETDVYAYAGAAYACAEIVLAGLRHAATAGASSENLREVVRAYVTDPANRFETVLGPVRFDANGDSTQQVVTFYRVDPLAAGGAGDWVVVKQQDFGPAR